MLDLGVMVWRGKDVPLAVEAKPLKYGGLFGHHLQFHPTKLECFRGVNTPPRLESN